MNIEVKIETTSEASHLPTVSLPNVMPWTMMKKMETPLNINAKQYAMILHHHGNVAKFLCNELFLAWLTNEISSVTLGFL